MKFQELFLSITTVKTFPFQIMDSFPTTWHAVVLLSFAMMGVNLFEAITAFVYPAHYYRVLFPRQTGAPFPAFISPPSKKELKSGPLSKKEPEPKPLLTKKELKPE